MKSVTIHNQLYEYYSWEALGSDIFKLSRDIILTNQKFDRLIALAKGGLTLSRSLTDFLDIKEISSIQIEFYTGIGTTNKTPIITQSLPVSIKGEKVLVFDDIVDSGETLKLACEYMRYHGASQVTTAALIKKTWNTFPVDFTAGTSQAWVIFPNETRETIKLLAQLWQEAGDTPKQINDQLLKIGFEQQAVALFSPVK